MPQVSEPDHDEPPRRRAAELAANVSSIAEDAWNRLDFRRWLVFTGAQVRQGGRRVRGSLVPVLTASVAAFLAFTFSHSVLGHQTPFFAPIAAWICLGFTPNRVPRKVLEIGAGTTIGVAIGELVLLAFGAGGWQLAIGLVVGALIGRFLDRGDLFTIQAGVNAMVVIGMGTMYSQSTGYGPSRLIDALVGAATALVFTLLFPGDVRTRPRRYVSNLLRELSTTFAMMSEGLRSGNTDRLRDAYAQLRAVQELESTVTTVWRSASDVTAINPAMRRVRSTIDELGRQLELGTRALHSAEMLLRQTRGVVDELGPLPIIATLMDDAAETLAAQADAVQHWRPPAHARELAITLADACAPETAHVMDWRRSALLSIMRSVAIDLLQLTGLSREQARYYLPGTGPEVADRGTQVHGDEPSAIWGDPNLPS